MPRTNESELLSFSAVRAGGMKGRTVGEQHGPLAQSPSAPAAPATNRPAASARAAIKHGVCRLLLARSSLWFRYGFAMDWPVSSVSPLSGSIAYYAHRDANPLLRPVGNLPSCPLSAPSSIKDHDSAGFNPVNQSRNPRRLFPGNDVVGRLLGGIKPPPPRVRPAPGGWG